MYIYIITHPKFKEWIKVGRAKNVNLRLRCYQSCCPDREYKIIFSIRTNYADRIEKYFHDNITGNGYEWYLITETRGIEIIKEQLSLINEDNNYLKPYRKDVYIKRGYPANKSNTNFTPIRYEYLVDGKIFYNRDELMEYLKMTPSMFNAALYKIPFCPGKVNTINGYDIIRKKHY